MFLLPWKSSFCLFLVIPFLAILLIPLCTCLLFSLSNLLLQIKKKKRKILLKVLAGKVLFGCSHSLQERLPFCDVILLTWQNPYFQMLCCSSSSRSPPWDKCKKYCKSLSLPEGNSPSCPPNMTAQVLKEPLPTPSSLASALQNTTTVSVRPIRHPPAESVTAVSGVSLTSSTFSALLSNFVLL